MATARLRVPAAAEHAAVAATIPILAILVAVSATVSAAEPATAAATAATATTAVVADAARATAPVAVALADTAARTCPAPVPAVPHEPACDRRDPALRPSGNRELASHADAADLLAHARRHRHRTGIEGAGLMPGHRLAVGHAVEGAFYELTVKLADLYDAVGSTGLDRVRAREPPAPTPALSPLPLPLQPPRPPAFDHELLAGAVIRAVGDVDGESTPRSMAHGPHVLGADAEGPSKRIAALRPAGDAYDMRERFAQGHYGEVWRAVRHDQPAGENSFVLKRLFVERGARVRLSGAREVWFGERLRNVPHTARFVEFFERDASAAERGRDSAAPAAHRSAPIRDMWLVFRDEGVGLYDVFYRRSRTGDGFVQVEPSEAWHTTKMAPARGAAVIRVRMAGRTGVTQPCGASS